MQNKNFTILCSFMALFIMSCGNTTSDEHPATSTDNVKSKISADCATSANANINIMFGAPDNPDTAVVKHTTPTAGAFCKNQGICDANSSAPEAISVSFAYSQGSGTTPSTVVMSFNYQTLFQKQPDAALFFYNNKPIPQYRFLKDFPLSKLGGSFATVCGTINPTAAGAGVITYNTPDINQPPFPPNANMTSNVVVTFTVSP